MITGILQTRQVLLTCNQGCSPLAGIPIPGKDLPSLPTTLLLALTKALPNALLNTTGSYSTLPLTKEPILQQKTGPELG